MPTTTKRNRPTKEKGKAKPKGGRPPSFVIDPSTMKRIVDLVRAGNFPEVAAQVVGVHRATFYRWLKQGGEIRRLVDVSRYTPVGYEVDLVRFCDDVEKASAESEARDVMLIGKAAEKDWKAAAHRLERRHRSRWAKENVEQGRHSFDGGDAGEHDAVEELAAILDVMANRRGAT